MSVSFGSAEWAAQIRPAVNASSAYRESARQWEGDFHFIIEPDAAGGQAVIVYVDLWHGECRAARLDPNASASPEFVIRGQRRNWVKVLRKEMDPIKALVTGALKLKGNLAKVMRNVRAAQDLVAAVAMVDTAF